MSKAGHNRTIPSSRPGELLAEVCGLLFDHGHENRPVFGEVISRIVITPQGVDIETDKNAEAIHFGFGMWRRKE